MMKKYRSRNIGTQACQEGDSCHHRRKVREEMIKRRLAQNGKKNAVSQTNEEEFNIASGSKLTRKPTRPKLRKANTSSNLTSARRAKLERLLEIENSKALRYRNARKEICDSQSLRSDDDCISELDIETYEEKDNSEFEHEEPQVEVVLCESTFFNGSSLIMQRVKQENPVLRNDEDIFNNSTLGIEFWILPILDNQSQDLRTKRSGLGFNNALLQRSRPASSWSFVMQKSKPTLTSGNSGVQLDSANPSNSHCTPTILLDKRTGQLRVQFSKKRVESIQEESMADALSQLLIAPESVSCDSKARLKNTEWAHIGVFVTPNSLILFVNGQEEMLWEASSGERVAFNWSPTFFGSHPIFDQTSKQVQGVDGFVGFLSRVNIHTKSTNADGIYQSAQLKPEFPQIPTMWGEVGENSTGVNAIGLVQDDPTRKNLAKREELRLALEQQILEKQRQEQADQLEKQREAEEIKKRAAEYERANEIERRLEQEQRRQEHDDIRSQLQNSFERKRMNALQELEQELRSTTFSHASTGPAEVTKAKDTTYAREIQEMMLQKRREKDMEKTYEREQEKLRIECEVREFQREQALERLKQAEKRAVLRKDLADQVYEKNKTKALQRTNLLSKEERDINFDVLQTISRDKMMQESSQDAVVLSKAEMDNIMKLLM